MDAQAGRLIERPAALGAALIAAAVLFLYVRVLRDQGGDPPVWVTALFLIGIAASLVTAARPTPATATVALGTLGLLTVLSLLTIGALLVPALLLLAFHSPGGPRIPD